jgi:hypothetical protein
MALLVATGTLEKVAWVLVAVIAVLVGGAAMSRVGGARHAQNIEDRARRRSDHAFRRPPDEGGLL